MKLIATLVATMVFSLSGFGAENQDADSFCKYQMEQAKAQRDLLRTPNLLSGLTQPETGLPMQAVWGLSNSLSSDKKSGLTMAVARKNCELYKAATATQQQVLYALSRVEQRALTHRLSLIQESSDKLDGLIDESAKRVEAQNMTQQMLYALRASKLKLAGDKLNTQTKIATLYAPGDDTVPLKDMLAQKQNDEIEEQKAIARLTRQSNWDVALTVGAHRQINTTTPVEGESPFAAYGQVSITYNLGSRSIGKHLDRAAAAYGDWKLEQAGDVVQSARVLKRQIVDSIAVEEDSLKVFQAQETEIQRNLRFVEGLDTSTALEFKNQLLVDELLLKVDLGDAIFRLGVLKEYLAVNFQGNSE